MESEQTESDVSIFKRKVNKLMVKTNEVENKFILHWRISKKHCRIGKKLNMNSINNMPKSEIKKFLCFPHYVKFDVKEDINPKSIPMYYLRNKNSIHDNRKNILSKSDMGLNINDYILKKLKENNNTSFELIEEENNNENKINDKLDLNNIEDEKILDKEQDIDLEEVKKMIELGKLKFDINSKKIIF